MGQVELDGDGEGDVQAGRGVRYELLYGAAGTLPNPGMAFGQRQVAALEIAEGLFDLHVFDVAEQRPGLLHRLVVPGQHDHRDPETMHQKPVQTIFADR